MKTYIPNPEEPELLAELKHLVKEAETIKQHGTISYQDRLWLEYCQERRIQIDSQVRAWDVAHNLLDKVMYGNV